MTDHQESEPKSCSVCHQTHQPEGESGEEFVTSPPKDLAEGDFWLKKGTFKTAPRTHAGCFMCHSAESGLTPTPSDCATCHKPLPPNQQLQLNQAHDDYDPKLTAAMGITDKLTLKLWSRRETARFRHEWAPHAVLSCVNCHNIAAINTADESTKRVPPLSCGGEGSGCHIDPAMEGTLNHEVEKKKSDPLFQCTKCHINNGKEPTPQSHLNLVAPAKKTS